MSHQTVNLIPQGNIGGSIPPTLTCLKNLLLCYIQMVTNHLHRRKMNTKHKGDKAVGSAIGFYTSQGLEVLLPIGDKQPYDLVIDRNNKLLKIQCKYTASQTKYGIFQVPLRVSGGNKYCNTHRAYKKSDFDILYVFTEKEIRYEIPFAKVPGTTTINLGTNYDKYKI